jgi:hypothetical protein
VLPDRQRVGVHGDERVDGARARLRMPEHPSAGRGVHAAAAPHVDGARHDRHAVDLEDRLIHATAFVGGREREHLRALPGRRRRRTTGRRAGHRRHLVSERYLRTEDLDRRVLDAGGAVGIPHRPVALRACEQPGLVHPARGRPSRPNRSNPGMCRKASDRRPMDRDHALIPPIVRARVSGVEDVGRFDPRRSRRNELPPDAAGHRSRPAAVDARLEPARGRRAPVRPAQSQAIARMPDAPSPGGIADRRCAALAVLARENGVRGCACAHCAEGEGSGMELTTATHANRGLSAISEPLANSAANLSPTNRA